jgi:hypothetical protein
MLLLRHVPPALDKDPEKYMKKMQDAGIAPEDASKSPAR